MSVPAAQAPELQGLIQLWLRSGAHLDVPIRGTPGMIHESVEELAHDVVADDGTGPMLFRLRPDFWVRRGEVVAVTFSPLDESEYVRALTAAGSL